MEFKTLTLEDNLPEVKPTIGLGNFKATSIYKDSSNDVWGLEKDACKNFTTTEVAADGSAAIELVWDRGVCGEWTGFGIGWNGWQPKDLSLIMETGAIQFKVRSVSGETNIPTMIFLLEDYGGVMTAAVFGSASLERYPINEDWQTAVIPLEWFTPEKDGCDMTNIKQLVVEMQNSGSLLIDEMEIVEYSDAYMANKPTIDQPSVVKVNAPTAIFDGKPTHAWGLGEYPCRSYTLDQTARGGLDLDWNDAQECRYREMGISWTAWIAVDMTGMEGQLALELAVKSDDLSGIEVGLEAYEYQRGMLALDKADLVGESDGVKTVRIPLSALKLGSESFPAGRIKQLLISTEGTGKAWIGSIQLVTL